MARVRINISMGVGDDYEVDLTYPETNGQAWGHDKTYVNDLLDRAVAQIKRAYNEPGGTE